MKAIKETNIIFWGTPDLCIPYLESLQANSYNIVAVVTAPDRPVGRKQTITSPATKIWAEEQNIPVLQPGKLDQHFALEIERLQADISVVIAYGRIIPEKIINTPTCGTLNVHYSLLPRWRGASPVEATILAGDEETGVSIQKMVFELDAGDIVHEEKINLSGNETTPELKQNLTNMGSKILTQVIENYIQNPKDTKPQDITRITKCGIISKSDAEINLGESPTILWRKYRAYKPWPGIFFFDQSGKRIKITQAKFEQGEFIIEKVIPEGRKEINWEQYKK